MSACLTIVSNSGGRNRCVRVAEMPKCMRLREETKGDGGEIYSSERCITVIRALKKSLIETSQPPCRVRLFKIRFWRGSVRAREPSSGLGSKHLHRLHSLVSQVSSGIRSSELGWKEQGHISALGSLCLHIPNSDLALEAP